MPLYQAFQQLEPVKDNNSGQWIPRVVKCNWPPFHAESAALAIKTAKLVIPDFKGVKDCLAAWPIVEEVKSTNGDQNAAI